MKRSVLLSSSIVVLMLLIALRGGRAASQVTPAEVGGGLVGAVGFSIIGTTEYAADAVQSRGYLVAVAALEPVTLFTDPDARSAASARFTFVLDAPDVTPTESGQTTVIDGTGTLSIYLQENGGADTADPASFAAGTPIAAADVQVQDILQADAPDLIVVASDAELTQTSAEPFTLDGETYRFGHPGLRLHLLATGEGAPGADDAETSVIQLTGNATVTDRGRPAIISGTPAPATPAAGDDCTSVTPWVDSAQARLDLAAALVEAVPATLEDATDAAAIQEAATEIEALASAQREAATPADGEKANRLLVTALSTAARGLALLATAVEQADADAFNRGRQTLNDGVALAERAVAEMQPLASACGVDLQS